MQFDFFATKARRLEDRKAFVFLCVFVSLWLTAQ